MSDRIAAAAKLAPSASLTVEETLSSTFPCGMVCAPPAVLMLSTVSVRVQEVLRLPLMEQTMSTPSPEFLVSMESRVWVFRLAPNVFSTLCCKKTCFHRTLKPLRKCCL